MRVATIGKTNAVYVYLTGIWLHHCHSFVLVVLLNQTIPGPWHRFTKSKGQFSLTEKIAAPPCHGWYRRRTRERCGSSGDGDDAKILEISSKTTAQYISTKNPFKTSSHTIRRWLPTLLLIFFYSDTKGRKDGIFLQMGWQNPPSNDTFLWNKALGTPSSLGDLGLGW